MERRPAAGWNFLRCLSSLLLMGSACAVAQVPTHHFNIPASDAPEAFNRYIAQSGVGMLYEADKVRGTRTNAIAGDLDAKQALEIMLKGTTLSFSFGDDGSYVTVAPREGPAEREAPGVPAATLTAPPPSDLSRRYPWIDGVPLTEVVVTGTLVRGVVDIMSPLEFVTKRDMAKSKYATVQDALAAIPQAAGGGPIEPSVATDGFARGSSVNLRGLGTGATLVLVDGRRQPYSGTEGDFVDVSNIPWNAIDHIEVLPDGASALYGSDAIAGVVNVITRKSLDGAETLARYSAPVGGGKEKTVAHLLGNPWDTGNVLFAYQYAAKSALPASARAYAADADKRPFGGSDFRSPSSSPGNILDPITLLPTYGIPAERVGKPLTLADLTPGEINLQNRNASLDLVPNVLMHAVFLSGRQEVGTGFELFGDVRFSRRDLELNSFAAERNLIVPRTNPFFASPFANAPFVFVGYSFLNDLGPSVIDAQSRMYAVNAGVKADVDPDWRLSFTLSDTAQNTRYTGYNQPDPAALAAALADPDIASAFNPFGDGHQNSEAILDAIRSVQTDGAVSHVSSLTAIADGAVFELPSGTTKLAVGAEKRREQFVHGTVLHRRLSRSIQSAFAELSVPLVGSKNDFAVPRLELSLAGRVEQYSDFGQAANPKIGLRWAPSQSLRLRATWGTSFRAPKLVDLYDDSQTLALLVSVPDSSSRVGRSIALARQGNNPDLKPEVATTWTAGLDLAPRVIPDLEFSLTYYSIDYDNRVVVPGPSSPFDVLLQEEQWRDIVNRDPSPEEIDAVCTGGYFRGSISQCRTSSVAAILDFTVRNMARNRVRGFDLSAQWRHVSPFGWFDVGLKGAYISEFSQTLALTSPPVGVVDTVGNPLALRARSTFEWSQRGFDTHGFGASCALTYTGAYKDLESRPTRKVTSFSTMDLWLSYRTAGYGGLWSDVEVTAGVVNVFNLAPPFVNREIGFDIANADAMGRVVSVGVQKRW